MTTRLGWCSRCGRFVEFPLFWSPHNWEMRWCPSCKTDEDLKREIQEANELMKGISVSNKEVK